MNSHTTECCIITLSVMANFVFLMQMTMQVTDLKRFAEADKTDLIYNHFFGYVIVCLVHSLCIHVFDISINFQRLSGYIRIFFCFVSCTSQFHHQCFAENEIVYLIQKTLNVVYDMYYKVFSSLIDCVWFS